MHTRNARLLIAVLWLGPWGSITWAAERTLVLGDVGVPGGLCVQVGGGDTRWAAELSATGRFLVQVVGFRVHASSKLSGWPTHTLLDTRVG
jgi:hypothetical protein